MDELFDTYTLNRALSEAFPPPSFLLDRFFPSTQESPQEHILFDVDKSKPRIAPFVSPLIAGKVQPRDGYETHMFKPAYVKIKDRFDANTPIRRLAGEPLGGNLTPQERTARQIASATDSQIQSVTYREALMAVELLRTGKVTVAGEDYPTVVVDMKRDPSLTVTLAGAARWGETDVSPSDDIETWINLIISIAGGNPTTVIMDPKAWGLVRKEEKFMKLLDVTRATNSNAELGIIARARDTARRVGNNGDAEYWVYNGRYVDEAGQTQQYLPDYSVIIGDASLADGVRAYGRIMDHEAEFEVMRYFQKSWMNKDPSVRWLLLQSAPLPFLYRPNATFYAKVR